MGAHGQRPPDQVLRPQPVHGQPPREARRPCRAALRQQHTHPAVALQEGVGLANSLATHGIIEGPFVSM